MEPHAKCAQTLLMNYWLDNYGKDTILLKAPSGSCNWANSYEFI